MKRISNSKQLEEEKMRLQKKEQQLKEEIASSWQDIRKQFAPGNLLKDELLSRGKAWVKHRIISKVKDKLFDLSKK